MPKWKTQMRYFGWFLYTVTVTRFQKVSHFWFGFPGFSKLETEEEATTTSSTTTEATKPTFATASVKVNHIKAANEEEVAEVNLTSSIKAIEEDETPKPSLPVEFARGPKFTSFDVKIDERK